MPTFPALGLDYLSRSHAAVCESRALLAQIQAAERQFSRVRDDAEARIADCRQLLARLATLPVPPAPAVRLLIKGDGATGCAAHIADDCGQALCSTNIKRSDWHIEVAPIDSRLVCYHCLRRQAKQASDTADKPIAARADERH